MSSGTPVPDAAFAPVDPVEVGSFDVESPPTTSPANPPSRRYHGGFSTSLCDLFSDPQDRSSCCALTFFGVFLQARNRHALNETLPPPWWTQVAIAMAFAISFAFTYKFFSILFYLYTSNPLPLVSFMLAASAVSLPMVHRRAHLRQDIAAISQEGSVAASHAGQRMAHVHHFITFVAVDSLSIPSNREGSRDFCTTLWSILAIGCCGCCGCWCNCCGICATGQEHRELRRRLRPERFWFDYITFQPYHEYAFRIEMLRRANSTSFWEHLSTLSQLSARLVKLLFGSVLVLCLNLFKHFHISNVFVIVATLAQAFAVVYCVHWLNHRLDLSLDAVIKLFASGFFLASTAAIFIELVVGFLGEIFFTVVMDFGYLEDNANVDPSGPVPDPAVMLHDIYEHHPITLILFTFFQSFFVAALVEELAKYFSFWMVEHPDFMPQETVRKMIREGHQINGAGDDPGADQPLLHRTACSRAAAITAGLVATATGFACSENLLYTLGFGRSFKSEILVLLMRSLLPFHPIGAAVQSVGIVRRDVEGVGSLGGAVIPAIVLHGLYDFVIMLVSLMVTVSKDPSEEEGSTAEGDTEAEQDLDIKSIVSAIGLGLPVIILSLLYYWVTSRRQRDRLRALDANAEGMDNDCGLEENEGILS